MAIAFDAVTTANHGSTTSFNWTHTPSGTPTLAVVYGYYTSAAGPTSVTYGGTSMMKLVDTVGNATVGIWLWLYYLPNPPSGTQTVQVNKASDGQNADATSTTYTGTATDSTAVGNSTSGNDTTSSGTTNVSLTASTATSWFLATGSDSAASQTGVSGGGATWSKHLGAANIPLWDSNGVVNSGAQTITYTWSGTHAAHEWISLEIQPPSAAASTTPSTLPLKSLLGVGI